MRTVLLIVLVVVAHLAAVGGIMMIQGCGTPVAGDLPSSYSDYGNEDVVMPPAAPVVDMPPPAPVRDIPHFVDDPPPAPSWPVETSTYVVRRGDTLSGIASRYKLKMTDILEINQIKNKNSIRAGQQLILPGKVNVSAPPPRTRPRAPAARPASPGNYVVQRGDCLSKIAVKFKTSVSAIKKANNMTSDMIRVGDKIIVPGAPAAGTPAAPPSRAPLPPPPAPGPSVPEPLMPEPDSGPIVDMPPPPTVEAPAAPAPPEPTAAAPAGPQPPAGESYRIYVVGENEDLYSVGLLWNVSVAKIKEINGLTDTTLKPGQRLKIPTAD